MRRKWLKKGRIGPGGRPSSMSMRLYGCRRIVVFVIQVAYVCGEIFLRFVFALPNVPRPDKGMKRCFSISDRCLGHYLKLLSACDVK